MSPEERVVVYTTESCPYCVLAKRLLDAKGVPFTEVDVARDPERRRQMVEQSGRMTVPQVFIDGVPRGGFDDLRALDAAGRLDALLGVE